MASPLGDVLLKFRVNTAPLDQGLAKMQTKIDRLARHISGLKFGPTTMFGNTGRSIDKLASAISKGIAGGVSAGAKAGSNAFAKSIDEMERKHKRFAAGMEARGKRIISQGRRAYRSASKQKSDSRAAMNAARNMPAYNRARAKFRDATWKQRNAKNFIAYGKSKQKTGARLGKTTPRIVMAGKAASAVFGVVAKGVGVMAKLTGSVFGLINPFEKLGMLFDGFTNALTGLAGMLTSIAGKILQVGSLMALGVVATGGYFVKLAGEEEAALTNIIRVAGLAKDSMKDLRGNLLSVSSRSGGVSVGEVNQIAEFGARMGVGSKATTEKGKVAEIADFAQSLSHVRIALDDIPVEEAATKISRILNVFKLGIDKTTNFASALVMLDNASTATGRDILEITRRLAGTGSAMGISIQETMALSAAMRDVGIDIEVGGTSIQNFFVRMSSDLANFSKQLNIPKAKLENLIDTKPMEAMRVVLAELSKYSARDQAMLFTRLHLQGQRMTSTIWQLVQGFGKFDELLKGSRSNWESLEAIESAVNMKGQILWSTMQKLWNQVNEVAIETGTRFIPVVQELVGLFGDVVAAAKKIIENNNYFEGQAKYLTDYITMARVLMSNTTLATDFFKQKWKDVLSYAGELFKWLGGAAVDAAVYLGEQMGTLFANMVSMMQDNINIFVSVGEMIAVAIMNGLKQAMGNQIADFLQPILSNPLLLGKDAKFATDNMRPQKTDKLDLQNKATKVKEEIKKFQMRGGFGRLTDGMRLPGKMTEMPKFKNSPEGEAIAKRIAEETKKFDANRPGPISLKKPKTAVEEAIDAAAMADRIGMRNKTKIPQAMTDEEKQWRLGKFKERINGLTVGMKIGEEKEKITKSYENMFQSFDGKGNRVRMNGDSNNIERFLGAPSVFSPFASKKVKEIERERVNEKSRNEAARDVGYNRGMPGQGDKKWQYAERLKELGTPMAQNKEAIKQMSKFDAFANSAKKTQEAKQKAYDEVIKAGGTEADAKKASEKTGEEIRAGMLGRRANIGGPQMSLPEKNDYKPEFFGLEEFSKKIQTGIFDSKKNDPILQVKDSIDKQLAGQEKWQQGEGKQMADNVAALADMGRNGQLAGGVLTA